MPHNRSLLRDVHPPNLPWAAGSSSNDDQSAKAIAFHSRDLEMCPTLLDPILDATSSDGIPVHPTIVPQYAVLGEVVGVGGRQAAKASDTAGATERPVVLYNTNTPSTTLICGVQGVGKSHTLNAILEAALIKHDGCGQLVEPVTPLILHYDTVSDFKCLPCESVHLGTISDSSGGASPKVTVLVSPTNFKPMEQVYKGISNVDGLLKELRSVAIMTTYLPQVTVHPLLLSERDLTVKRVHNLMCVDEYTVKPLYINVIEQELRAINSRSERFSFSAFERAMANNQLNPQQSAMFDLRMSLIKSCIKEQVVSNKTFPPDLRQRASRTPPLSELFGIKGGVVIIDLSDPYIDRASACSLFDIVVGMFCAVGDKSRDAGGAGKIVVLDEAHKFLAQKNEGSIPLIETLTTLIAQQRHVGLRLLISTQDPTGVPVRILELTSTFILHAFNSPSWFNHLRAHIKFNGKGTGDEREGELRVFDVILSLPLGIAVVVSPRGLGISETSGVHANTVSREDGVRDFSSVQRMGGDYWIVSIRERITKDGGKSPVKFNQQVRNFEVSMNSLRKGTVISHKGKIWVITDYAMHSQGRQGSHYKVEMRDLLKGGKVTERCNPTATFEGLDLEDKHFQFLYADGGELHLMDKETMDIHQFPIDMIEGGSKSIVEFLNEDMDIKVSYHEDTPVRVKVPPTGVFKVEFTDPPAGGAQQSDKIMMKNARLSIGVDINVPEFVQTGDMILVDLADRRYKERVRDRAPGKF